MAEFLEVSQTARGMKILYLCYQSIRDPLTSSQVVAYLEGLSTAGHSVRLLTFEPVRIADDEASQIAQALEARGVRWDWRRYHKAPSMVATLWDIVVGARFAIRIRQREGLDTIHCRAHVPGMMALLVKGMFATKILFDVRGFMAEEYVDAGVWKPDGFLFRMTKRAEGRIIRASDAIVVLTTRARHVLESTYGAASMMKPLAVIPCCVDTTSFEAVPRRRNMVAEVTLVYVGKLGGWYWDEAMVEFIAALRRTGRNVVLNLFTQSDSASFMTLCEKRGVADAVSIGRVPPEDIPKVLSNADAGLALIRPLPSKIASSPTKVGEYLAAGLPVIATSGIGDLDELLLESSCGRVGVLVKGDSVSDYDVAAESLLALLQERDIHQRCRDVAKESLDMRTVGWSKYREVYVKLAAGS